MQMKKICVRTMSILTAAAVLSGGCSAWEGPSGGRLDVNPEPAVSPEPPAFEADPASFSLTVFTDEGGGGSCFPGCRRVRGGGL